jgi:hypothetical protein
MGHIQRRDHHFISTVLKDMLSVIESPCKGVDTKGSSPLTEKNLAAFDAGTELPSSDDLMTWWLRKRAFPAYLTESCHSEELKAQFKTQCAMSKSIGGRKVSRRDITEAECQK